VKNAPAAPLRFRLSPWGNGIEFAPVGVLGGAFLAMAVSVRDPSSVDRAILNREMGGDAVAQVFQNAIAAVWIRTGFRLAPPAGSCSLNRAEDFDRAAARSVFV
jgi:hypothetical protein